MIQVPRKYRDYPKLHIDCKRCGCCCIAAPCGLASIDDYGFCAELVVHENLKTSCGLVAKGQVPIFIEEKAGCFIRKSPTLFRIHVEHYHIRQRKQSILERSKEKHEKVSSFLA
jgi:hypothetical protein